MYFEKLGIFDLLNEKERHSIISNAAQTLLRVHNNTNNFYNEPPFAERLLEISKQGAIPDSTKQEFVETVLTCAVGNPYGACYAANVHYEKIIKGFNQREIQIMLALPKTDSIIARRLKEHARCKTMFKDLVGLLSPDSIPASLKTVYEKLL